MGQPLFRTPVRGRSYPPEILQALILSKLRRDAEAKLGPVSKAVITVPAYFNEPRRRATQDAGRLAGLDVIDILNEPTAAAICHGVQSGYLSTEANERPPETILVYDLGGGTFDVTLMRVEANRFTVLATAGDVELGGIDWDNRIIDHVAKNFRAKHGVDLRDDPHAAQNLRDLAEEAKRSLTSRSEAVVAVAHDGKRLRLPITRAQFEEMTADLLDRTVLTLRRLTRDAGVSFSEVTRLLAVGGSTRMPMVAAMLQQETGLSFDRSLSADEAVAHGAAIYAASKLGSIPGLPPLSVRNVSSHDLGILGIERATGLTRRAIMIKRNSPLPAEAKHAFGTHRDGQKSADIKVVEGGDASGNGATPVGKCSVTGLPSGLPKGTKIEVMFRYEQNGRLNISASVPAAGKSVSTTIAREGGMPEEQFAAWAAVIATGLPDGTPLPGDAPMVEEVPTVSVTSMNSSEVITTAATTRTVPAESPEPEVASPASPLAPTGPDSGVPLGFPAEFLKEEAAEEVQDTPTVALAAPHPSELAPAPESTPEPPPEAVVKSAEPAPWEAFSAAAEAESHGDDDNPFAGGENPFAFN
jgi:molecular chaperone DnaK